MIEVFLSAFVPLLLIIDPLGLTPIVMGLTRDLTPAQVIRTVIKAGLVAVAILLVFGLIGDAVLEAFGIGLPAFRIAGGLLLFITALQMIFSSRRPRQKKNAEKIEEELEGPDIAVFPIAMPLIAGPGAITTVMLLTSRPEHGWAEVSVALLAMMLVIGITVAVLSVSAQLHRIMGETLPDILTRILGLLLASLAVQYVADGVLALLAPLFASA